MNKPGERLQLDGGIEVLVTTGGDGTIAARASDDAAQVGKRYHSPTGVEVLVVKPGSGALFCDDETMTLLNPKQTKAAD